LVTVAGVAAASVVVLVVTLVVQSANGRDEPGPSPTTTVASPEPTTPVSTPSTTYAPPTTYAPSTPASATSTVGESIPDNDITGIYNSVQLTGSGTVGRLRVHVEVDHPVASDLRVWLRSPSGRFENIGDGDRFSEDLRYTFDSDNPSDTAGTELALFIGEVYDGEWEINVYDGSGADVGVFESWWIEVSPA
jgi:subtilisin-like proprotein convertase family protein